MIQPTFQEGQSHPVCQNCLELESNYAKIVNTNPTRAAAWLERKLLELHNKKTDEFELLSKPAIR
jgi:hypothetical protein